MMLFSSARLITIVAVINPLVVIAQSAAPEEVIVTARGLPGFGAEQATVYELGFKSAPRAWLHLLAQPLDGLTVDLAGTWLDHEYGNYRALRFGPAGPTVFDFSGNALQWVADYQAVVQIDYRRPFTLGGIPVTGSARIAASFTGLWRGTTLIPCFQRNGNSSI